MQNMPEQEFTKMVAVTATAIGVLTALYLYE
jgi:hypothetical protein